MIIFKIYLKCVKKPFVFEITKEKVNDFYSQLMTHDIVKFGPIIFDREQFKYAEVVE